MADKKIPVRLKDVDVVGADSNKNLPVMVFWFCGIEMPAVHADLPIPIRLVELVPVDIERFGREGKEMLPVLVKQFGDHGALFVMGLGGLLLHFFTALPLDAIDNSIFYRKDYNCF